MSHQVTEFLNWDLLRLAWEDLPRETKAFLCSYIRDVKSDDLESHVKHIVRRNSPVLLSILKADRLLGKRGMGQSAISVLWYAIICGF